MKTPDLNDVALFVDVIHTGSFSQVARARGVPVSTVSRRIARLESAFDARLLERTTRRLHITEAGKAYFAHAERALDELGQGSDKLHALDASPRGRIRITAPVGLGSLVTSALASYLERYPAVVVEVDLTDRRIDLFAEGFDIALRSGPVDTPDFVGKKIFEATRWLFASKAYLARRGWPKRIADLANHDLLTTRASESGATWELIDSRGRLQRFSFQPRFVVNELMAVRHAAISGAGIALLPSPEAHHAELERVLPNVSGPRGGMWLLYPAHRSLTAAVRTCVEHLLASLPVQGTRESDRRSADRG